MRYSWKPFGKMTFMAFVLFFISHLFVFAAVCFPFEFCVSNDDEMDQALSISAENKEDDVIRIVLGSNISSFSPPREIGHSLRIEGGYSEGCSFKYKDMEESGYPKKEDETTTHISYPDQQSTTGPNPPDAVGPKTSIVEGAAVSELTTTTILGVPGYAWRHGCGPTALGMVLGYYDLQGFSDLFEGDAFTQTAEVNQGIASERSAMDPGHYEDYSLPLDYSGVNPEPLPDRSETPYGDEHAGDSIADYMKTSWSSESNYYGWSWFSDIGPAFMDYIDYKNPGYTINTEAHYIYNGSLTWNFLTQEIDNNRPMVFLVDSTGDGHTDHFVTVIGYKDAPTQEYGCLDTWAPAETIRWVPFRAMSNQYSWGVAGGWSFFIEIKTCEGDLDHDFDADGSDLAGFASDFGRTDCSGDCGGDFDGDGAVNGADLETFANGFGRTDCAGDPDTYDD